jgi:hypothetical protein
MANTSDISSASIDSYPEELVRAVAIEAEADADRVASFLRALGYDSSPSKPLFMDREVLLFLGAVLRLESWEEAGIPIHHNLGLRPATDLLTDAARALAGEARRPDGTGLGIQVTKIFVEHFAWGGRHHLDAPVILDALDEDKALDTLAELLWRRRLAERGGAA